MLSGTWLCFLNSHWSSFSRFTLPFQHTLWHITNTASPPSFSWLIHPSPSPPTSAPPAVLRDSTLPVSSVLAWLTCLSVFYPRHWVTRPLTSGELASAFDLPHCLASPTSPSSMGCLSAPAKILSGIWNSCYRIKGGDDALNQVFSSDIQNKDGCRVTQKFKVHFSNHLFNKEPNYITIPGINEKGSQKSIPGEDISPAEDQELSLWDSIDFVKSSKGQNSNRIVG